MSLNPEFLVFNLATPYAAVYRRLQENTVFSLNMLV